MIQKSYWGKKLYKAEIGKKYSKQLNTETSY
jgi:hypothetical protein